MGAYNDDVLFIHIPKCGGTAVKHYMAAHLPGVLWPKVDDVASVGRSGLPIGHVPLRDIEQFTGRPLDSWERIIATIRNPYEQQVSQWWFWHKRYALGDNHPHSVHAATHPRIHSWLLDPDCDFHLWYEYRFHPDSELVKRPPSAVTSYADWGGYYWYWLSVDGALPPNLHVVKMEEMGEKVPLLLAPYLDGPLPNLPVVNKGGEMDLDRTLSSSGVEIGNRSLDIITHKFRWCIEQGYYRRLEMSPA